MELNWQKALSFSASLRLSGPRDSSVSQQCFSDLKRSSILLKEDRKELISELLGSLGLGSCADTSESYLLQAAGFCGVSLLDQVYWQCSPQWLVRRSKETNCDWCHALSVPGF